MGTWALFSMLSGILSLLCLVTLHFVSREFQPSWRMISEYAMGKHKGFVTAFFYFWGASALLLCPVLWNELTTGWSHFGIILLAISGIGAIMGGLFDVKHKLHGLAFGLGVPTAPAAALLIAYALAKQELWEDSYPLLFYISHPLWISLVLMAVAMVVMMTGFKKAGIPMEPNAPVPEKVPDGVIALAGYANRLLVFCYVFWIIFVAYVYWLH